MSHRLKLTVFALPFHVIGFAESYLLREGSFTLLAKAWAMRGVVTKTDFSPSISRRSSRRI
jgi:hypothetical protein